MPKTRKDLTISQKNELLQRYDELRKQRTTQRTAASTLGIAQSTLATLLKQRSNFKLVEDDLQTSRKRHRLCNHKDIDEALLIWFHKEKLKQQNTRISRTMIREKAMKFAKQFHVDGFTCSDGWISRWRSRHGVVLQTSCSERCPDLEVDEWIESVLPATLKEFEPQNVYNCDETGLYFRALPDHSFLFSGAAGKRHKEHFTLLLTCNMDGSEKLDPLVIGKSKNPRCFKAVKRLPIPYEANSNAWMSCGIFESFLRQWNSVLVSNARRVALVLDNCTAHPNVELSHIKLVFIPENTASCVQPLDQGIIKTFKAHYRRELRRRINFELDDTCLRSSDAFEIANKVTVLDAVHMIRDAWDAVTPMTISNCFRHVKTASSDTDEQDEECNDDEVEDDDEAWASIDEQLMTAGAELTPEDVVNTVQGAENHSDDDEDVEFEMQTGKCLREAFSVIRQLVYTSEKADRSHIAALKTLENLTIHTDEKKIFY